MRAIFVEPPDLLNRRLRTRTVGGVGAGGWGLETPGYPIRRHRMRSAQYSGFLRWCATATMSTPDSLAL